MNYYNEIKNKLVDNEIYSKLKDYSKERHRVITYYEIGYFILKAVSIWQIWINIGKKRTKNI